VDELTYTQQQLLARLVSSKLTRFKEIDGLSKLTV